MVIESLGALPPDRVKLSCFATLSLDLIDGFWVEMGLSLREPTLLRSVLRRKIESDPERIRFGRVTHGQELLWSAERWSAELFSECVLALAPDDLRDFLFWIRNTYTGSPTDRPEWEAWESFFFLRWIEVRQSEDTSSCFSDPGDIWQYYHSMVKTRYRLLEDKIASARGQTLSEWDKSIFVLRRYTLGEVDDFAEDDEFQFDPFSDVKSTADRHYFQEFWSYLCRRLLPEEKKRLQSFASADMLRRDSVHTTLVDPDILFGSIGKPEWESGD